MPKPLTNKDLLFAGLDGLTAFYEAQRQELSILGVLLKRLDTRMGNLKAKQN
ncbi:MAG: hypothetical protein AAB772_01345 [Patescibacteria group bacterium]